MAISTHSPIALTSSALTSLVRPATLLGLPAGLPPDRRLFSPRIQRHPEIIVTAERRAENLQTVPIAVSAFDETQLKDRQIVDSQDLRFVVTQPHVTNNIHLTDQPVAITARLAAAGRLADRCRIALWHLCGRRVRGPAQWQQCGANDIERIEVLRGPQGTLYGRNTLQGASVLWSGPPVKTSGSIPWCRGHQSVHDERVRWRGLRRRLRRIPVRHVQHERTASTTTSVRSRTRTTSKTGRPGKLRYMGIDKADIVLAFPTSTHQ